MIFARLNWNWVVKPKQLEWYCRRVNHETVGKDCHCRCGLKIWEPWEMPLQDKELVLNLMKDLKDLGIEV